MGSQARSWDTVPRFDVRKGVRDESPGLWAVLGVISFRVLLFFELFPNFPCAVGC